MSNLNNTLINIDQIKISNTLPFVLFGGLNVLETYDLTMHVCEHYVNITNRLNIPFIFKASFDKANRSSLHSYRGIGLEDGLDIFQKLKKNFGVKIITDVHEKNQVASVSEVVDIIQLPAFLSRQTDLVIEIAKSGIPVNIKKPQFMSPYEIKNIVEKILFFGNKNIIICERGTTFGYERLIVDMLGFKIIKNTTNQIPVIFDVTHALQYRTPLTQVSNGYGEQVFELARAGIAVGLAGLFIETYPDPKKAKCDGCSALTLCDLEKFLIQMKEIDSIVKNFKNI